MIYTGDLDDKGGEQGLKALKQPVGRNQVRSSEVIFLILCCWYECQLWLQHRDC